MRPLAFAALAASLMVGTAIAAEPTPATEYRTMVQAEVELECSLQPDRSVRDCRVLRETPKGAGDIAIRRKLGPDYRAPVALAAQAKNGKVRLSVPFPIIPTLPTS